MLSKGARGPAVKTLQEQILRLGGELPRFGADGSLGEETLVALDDLLFAHRDLIEIKPDGVVTDGELALLEKLEALREDPVALPPGYVDLTDHPIPSSRWWRYRGWSKTTGIVLHQTACIFGAQTKRWLKVPAHLGITQRGEILHLNALDWAVPHAHGLNGSTVGIEIEGRFPGIEGDLETLWNHPENSPTELTDAQVEATLEAIRWVSKMVEQGNGRLRFLWAHRQSCDASRGQSPYGRRSDPGGEIWRRIAIPIKQELGLLYGAEGGVIGSGLPLPREWDPERVGFAY